MFYMAHYISPLGEITLGSDGNGLAGLWLEGQKYYADKVFETPIENADLAVFIAVKKWLDDYFDGKRPGLSDLPLSPRGGEFRQAVWAILCDIPYGELTTYGEIARKMAVHLNKANMSSQAVGGAVGHNPISIIIPCHRVVGSNGSLTGYAGGIDKKVKLLEHEHADLKGLFISRTGTAL